MKILFIAAVFPSDLSGRGTDNKTTTMSSPSPSSCHVFFEMSTPPEQNAFREKKTKQKLLFSSHWGTVHYSKSRESYLNPSLPKRRFRRKIKMFKKSLLLRPTELHLEMENIMIADFFVNRFGMASSWIPLSRATPVCFARRKFQFSSFFSKLRRDSMECQWNMNL